MQLIGYLDSPYVRRVAISMDLMGIPFEHRELSVLRQFDEFRAINPMVKVPTLVLDDGEFLVDSNLILDHLEDQVPPEQRLMPTDPAQRLEARRLLGTMLVALEKAVALIYERTQRPEELQHPPWTDRLVTQMVGAVDLLEPKVRDVGGWLFGERMLQPDLTLAVGWRFLQFRWPGDVPAADYPGLAGLSERAEALAAFRKYSF